MASLMNRINAEVFHGGMEDYSNHHSWFMAIASLMIQILQAL